MGALMSGLHCYANTMGAIDAATQRLRAQTWQRSQVRVLSDAPFLSVNFPVAFSAQPHRLPAVFL